MSDLKASRPGERNGRARLTARAVERIRRAHAGGALIDDLAEAYGVHRTTIWQAVKGLTWRSATNIDQQPTGRGADRPHQSGAGLVGQ